MELALLTIYYLALTLLTIYSVHRAYLVRLRRRGAAPPPPPISGSWPSVAIQLPLFNEPNVAARLIDAVCRIEYEGALEVQVLDDSTDATTSIVAARVSEWASRGRRVTHIRRDTRAGFKAGALAYGMSRSNADLFLVFDADFVPQRDLLQRIVPHFADPAVGMVQARWGHLNREASLLTRVQAIYLDAHFAVESAARHRGGRFFNFNGTAGIWRRSAIESAGGWSASTLTEDLDLSYRAQLAGWKFVFLPDIEVPAELPAALSGFQEQQHRWAKGSIQTARKLLVQIVCSPTPFRVKSEAFFHLTNNTAYLLTLIVSLLIVPAILMRQRLGVGWTAIFDLLLFATSTCSVIAFYLSGQRYAGRPAPRLSEMLAVMPIGIGMSVRNASAVLEGAFQRGGAFRRTPKSGSDAPCVERAPRIPWIETLLSLFFAVAAAGFVSMQQWLSLPFVLLFLGGQSWIAATAWRERVHFASTH